MQRSEVYGYTDFLANCGGLLGLFLGFSILSIVEIIYFLTLRLLVITLSSYVICEHFVNMDKNNVFNVLIAEYLVYCGRVVKMKTS